MNKIFKAIALIAVFAAYSQAEGIRIGGKAGYSMQMFLGLGASNAQMSMFGLNAGVVADIPLASAGASFNSTSQLAFSPELLLIYRTNYEYDNYTSVGISPLNGYSQKEFAVSVPITLKYSLGNQYFQFGAQLDIPLSPFLCKDSDCIAMDGAEFKNDGEYIYFVPEERSSMDLGILLGYGYNITKDMIFDFRYVYYLTTHSKEKKVFKIGKDEAIEYSEYTSMMSIGFGLTYFF
ncbi:MAG: PorT family protein [Fibromonadaceae bacterium]|nr:PorT family protein [Fibromonadaceae bacterium]